MPITWSASLRFLLRRTGMPSMTPALYRSAEFMQHGGRFPRDRRAPPTSCGVPSRSWAYACRPRPGSSTARPKRPRPSVSLKPLQIGSGRGSPCVVVYGVDHAFSRVDDSSRAGRARDMASSIARRAPRPPCRGPGRLGQARDFAADPSRTIEFAESSLTSMKKILIW